jgi:hypothetical protein
MIGKGRIKRNHEYLRALELDSEGVTTIMMLVLGKSTLELDVSAREDTMFEP